MLETYNFETHSLHEDISLVIKRQCTVVEKGPMGSTSYQRLKLGEGRGGADIRAINIVYY